MLAKQEEGLTDENTLNGCIVCDLGAFDLEGLPCVCLNLRCSRARHIAELVGKSCEGSAEGGRGDLAEVDRDHTPSSLHTGLDEEAAS